MDGSGQAPEIYFGMLFLFVYGPYNDGEYNRIARGRHISPGAPAP